MKRRAVCILLVDLLLGLCVIFCGIRILGEEKNQTQHTAVMQERKLEAKKIALTFDDGPDPEYTPKLLAGLRERKVSVTFFLLGKQIAQYPDLVKEMYADGHEVACHSFEHVNLSKLSEPEACAQVEKTCQLIETITGEYPAFVRPPYGEWLPCLEQDFSLIPVLWDVDPLDWATQNAQQVVQKVQADVQEYDIILLHDASESSVQAALALIDILQQEGYEFVTVEELIFP